MKKRGKKKTKQKPAKTNHELDNRINLPSSFRFPGVKSPYPFEIPPDIWPLILQLEEGNLSDGLGLATSSKWGYNCFWDAVRVLRFSIDKSALQMQHIISRCSTQNLRLLIIPRYSVPFYRFEKLVLPSFFGLRDLRLAGFSHFTGDYLSQFSSLTNLHTLHLTGIPELDKGIPHLSSLTRLVELNLDGEFTFVAMSGLTTLTNLEVFGLDPRYPENHIPTEEMEFLRKLTKLQKLQFGRGCSGNGGLAIICSLSNLENLQFHPWNVTPKGMQHFTNLTSLRILKFQDRLESREFGYVEWFKNFSTLLNLEYLNLSYCPISSVLLPCSMCNFAMEWGYVPLDHFSTFLSQNSNLPHLKLCSESGEVLGTLGELSLEKEDGLKKFLIKGLI